MALFPFTQNHQSQINYLSYSSDDATIKCMSVSCWCLVTFAEMGALIKKKKAQL